MPPILLISVIAAAIAAEPPGTMMVDRVIDGIRFAPVGLSSPGSSKSAERESRIYRVRLEGRGQDAGTLAVDCDNAEIVGASFKPTTGFSESPLGDAAPSPSRLSATGDGTAIARAADNRLCD
jgi:hypothetical protein